MDVIAEAGLHKFHEVYPEYNSEAVWVVGVAGAVSLNIHRWEGLPISRKALGSVDRHSPKPLSPGDDECSMDHCMYLEGAPCWCDGSMLLADDLIVKWDAGEHDAVYIALAACYVSWLLQD